MYNAVFVLFFFLFLCCFVRINVFINVDIAPKKASSPDYTVSQKLEPILKFQTTLTYTCMVALLHNFWCNRTIAV